MRWTPAGPSARPAAYLAFGFAQFGTFTASQGGVSSSIDITDKSVHEWLQFGVKGTFDL